MTSKKGKILPYLTDYMSVVSDGLIFIKDYMERYELPFKEGMFTKTKKSIKNKGKHSLNRNMLKATRLRCRFDEVMRLIHMAQTKFKLLKVGLDSESANDKSRILEYVYDFAKVYFKIFIELVGLKEQKDPDCMQFKRIMKIANDPAVTRYSERLMAATGEIRRMYQRKLEQKEVDEIIDYFGTIEAFEALQKVPILPPGGSRSTRKSRTNRV